MNLNQLFYFWKLAQLQHFTKAAAELYISQPSLSYSIAKLEQELGTALFQKKGRNVVLTDDGKEFYTCVNESLTKLNCGIATLKKNIDISSSKINIGTIPILSSDFIPKNMRSYLDSFPQTTFDIFTCITDKEVISYVRDGVYDIGFCSKVETENDLIFTPILSQELVVITPKDHVLSKERTVNLSNLQEYPIITYRESTPLGIFIRNLFKEQNKIPNIVFSFDGEVTISQMVAQDFGIAVVVNTPILQNYNLSIIPLNAKSVFTNLYLAYYKNYNHSKTIKSFIHHLRRNATTTCI